jgi:hypothetical protein
MEEMQMAQINTRIVLRNDTKAAWEAVKDTATLMVGEMGVETDTGLFKIGCQKKNAEGAPMFETDGTTPVLCTWAELEYANDIPEIDLSTVTNEVQVVDGTIDDLAAGKVVGDMAIVRAVINGNVKSHTAYVWNGTAWEAMDGNYDASNVYFKNDITLAGSYTAVGNVTKSSNAATGTLSAAGKSLDQVMQSIFTKELYPAKNASRDVPNITLEGDADASGEVGSSYTLPTVQVRVTDVGSYGYGPATGIKFEAGNMTIAQGAIASATNKKSNENDMVDESTLSLTATDTETLYTDSAKSYTFNASGTYTAGAAPKTNLGTLLDDNDDSSTWTYRIPSGTATATARTIKRTGYRYMFCGGTTAATVDSAVVRAFSAKKSSKPTTEGAALEFTAAGGTTKVVCVYPSSWTGTPYFEMFGLAWAENSNFVAKSNINVADARGTKEDGTLNGSMAYKMYAWELDAPLEAETTKFRVYFK